MNAIPNIVVIPLKGDLDVTTVASASALIDSFLYCEYPRMILNLADVSFIDSSGMGLLWSTMRRIRAHQGIISMINVQPQVLAILRRARMLDFIPLRNSDVFCQKDMFQPHTLPLWQHVIQIDPKHLCTTRGRVQEELSQLAFSSDELFDLMLAIGEAMGNAVDHTDGSCSLVRISAYSDRAIVDITDCGEGYEITCVEDLPKVDEGAMRGRGIHLMSLLVDGLSIGKRLGHSGTRVHIVKFISAARA